jgi:hypothetical protein
VVPQSDGYQPTARDIFWLLAASVRECHQLEVTKKKGGLLSPPLITTPDR